MRARQTHRAGPIMRACSPAVRSTAGTACPQSSQTRCMTWTPWSRPAFPVRGVVRASSECPSKKRQHFHNSPVGAPSMFGAPTYTATPLPYRKCYFLRFLRPLRGKSPKRWKNFYGSRVFRSGFRRLCAGAVAHRRDAESGAVRSSLRYPSPGGSMMRRSYLICLLRGGGVVGSADRRSGHQQGGGQRGTPPPTGTQPQGRRRRPRRRRGDRAGSGMPARARR